MTACCHLSPLIHVASVSGLLVAGIGPADGGSRGRSVEIVAGNPGVFQLYPYPYPPNPYPWPGVWVLEGKCTGLHGFGEFGGFGKFCRLTYIHICIA